MYQIGKITNTHGIKGEVKIYNLSDFNRFFVGASLYVILKGEKHTLTIERVRAHKNVLITKFKEYNDINDILKFKGLDVFTDEEPDELESDDYHYHDLIGKDVYLKDGTKVGRVLSLMEVPQGHLLEVLNMEDKKALIPFRSEFVSDVLDDRIIITPIEGMI